MDLVLIAGYAKLPGNTTAQRVYEQLALVIEVDMDSGFIQKADCTMVTGLAKDFVNRQMSGYDLNRGAEPLLLQMDHAYQGHLKKALLTAIKNVSLQYDTLKGSGEYAT